MGSLVQAVQGRSHQQYRVTSHRGQGALQGVKSECNQQVTGTMLRAVLMLSLVALSVTQRRPPPGFDDYEDANSGNSVQGRARAWTWVSSPSREERGLSSTLIRGTRALLRQFPSLLTAQRKLPKPLARLLISARLADDVL